MKTTYKSREITIGSLRLGNEQPIRLQSMTNTSPLDTAAGVAQAVKMIEAGSELIRVTAPGLKEAENLKNIRKGLDDKGYQHIPLIADIHFNPRAAEIAAAIVEKVRINPGNYVEHYNKNKISFTDKEYQTALQNIKKRLEPLILQCKKHGTALRIGSNHGSLSQRIMSRFGDTPEGMAESAMEFLRICNALDFHNIVVSMKSSNTRVMVHATRLVAQKMKAEGLNYPIHLGVTEAGNGLEGRIKSATGISTLLGEGLGDTIRVSLTEPPENELPVARQIVKTLFPNRKKTYLSTASENLAYQERPTQPHPAFDNLTLPVVVGKSSDKTLVPDFTTAGFDSNENLLLRNTKTRNSYPFHQVNNFSALPIEPVPIIAEGDKTFLHELFNHIQSHGHKHPVILKYHSEQTDLMRFAIETATVLGPFFLDGLAQGLWLENPHITNHDMLDISFKILQATRSRITETEYIACPSCGRTLFDIESTLEAVKAKTRHLKGLKIAVMGCTVNGPGEMADADYGYIGGAVGKVNLYRKKELVKKNIPQEHAIEALLSLIEESKKM